MCLLPAAAVAVVAAAAAAAAAIILFFDSLYFLGNDIASFQLDTYKSSRGECFQLITFGDKAKERTSLGYVKQ